MDMHRHWMIENADMLKSLRQQDRNKGHHTGKSAKGWNKKVSDFAPVELGSWDDIRSRAKHAWYAMVRLKLSKLSYIRATTAPC